MTVEKSSFRSPSLEQETIESLSRKLFEANLQLKQLQQEREEMLANISTTCGRPSRQSEAPWTTCAPGSP